MAAHNYDLYRGEDDSLYMYLSSSWYWINKPGHHESRSRRTLPKGIDFKKFGSLRDIAISTVEYREPDLDRVIW